ncbi:uncharacterized protein LOC144554801 [Carex rostrata]
MATSSSSSLMATTKYNCNYYYKDHNLKPLNPTKTLPRLSFSTRKKNQNRKPICVEASSFSTQRQGIWSIRDDLVMPNSAMGMQVMANNNPKDKGPPPLVMERFHSVIDQLFNHRIIRLGGPLEDDVANVLVSQLLYLDAVDPTKDIVMYVNSPGGSVTAGMAVFDTMKHIRADVSTVCIGLAASMSAFILSAGTKGKRYSLPNARIMIHQPLGGVQGSTTDMEIQVNEVVHHHAVLSGYLAYFTGHPVEKIVSDTDKDFFMSAKEAKEYGLIDDVITNPLKALQPQPVSN